jgi:SAM-dependent methyltransferase
VTDGPYRVSGDRTEVEREGRRHDHLAAVADARTRRVLERLGLAPGWRCLDVGTGGASLARWLAERVGPEGRVLATDVDLRFAERGGRPANLELRRHDVTRDPLPAGAFDLVHARAVLQHLAEREQVLDRLLAATRPGGLVVVEDLDWVQFDLQEIPEPFATLSRRMRELARTRHGYDDAFGRRLLAALSARGLERTSCDGHVFTMRGGTPSAEWYVLALERAAPGLVAAGLLDGSLVAEALARARRPDFAILSPIALLAWGWRPAA